MEYTVLVCDDDEDILSALEIYLRQAEYRTIRATNGLDAVRAANSEDVHLVLLDVMMPMMDGIQAAVKIRETHNMPIIFLSAKSEDTDRVLGLDMGGDDYVTKPFNPVELLARVRAALRRYARLGGLRGAAQGAAQGSSSEPPTGPPPGMAPGPAPELPPKLPPGPAPEPPPRGVYQTGGLILDDSKKSVTVDGEDAPLTALEYNILKYLMSNMERVFTSAQIYEAVWDEPAFHVSKIVSVHVRHIREKIEAVPKEPRYLKVIYGLGYKVVKSK